MMQKNRAEQSSTGTGWGLISDVLQLSERDRKDSPSLSTLTNVLGRGNDRTDDCSMEACNLEVTFKDEASF